MWTGIGLSILMQKKNSSGATGGETITAISTIRAGETFTITGIGLTGVTSVTINSVACSSVVVVNDTTVTATAPTDGFVHDELYTVEVL